MIKKFAFFFTAVAVFAACGELQKDAEEETKEKEAPAAVIPMGRSGDTGNYITRLDMYGLFSRTSVSASGQTTVEAWYNEYVLISYNNNGSPARMDVLSYDVTNKKTSDSYSMAFVYDEKGGCTITTTGNGPTYTVTKTDSGYNWTVYYNNRQAVTVYTLDANRRAVKINDQPVTWSNGNISKMTGSGTTYTFEYGSEKNVWAGFDMIGHLLTQRGFADWFLTQNLPTKLTSVSDGLYMNFSYERDSKGRLSKISLSGTAVPKGPDGSMQYIELKYGKQLLPKFD